MASGAKAARFEAGRPRKECRPCRSEAPRESVGEGRIPVRRMPAAAPRCRPRQQKALPLVQALLFPPLTSTYAFHPRCYGMV